MSYIFLQEQGEESLAEFFSDIPAYVLSRLNLTAAKSCSNGNGMESCQGSQSGTMSERSMENHGEDQSTLFAEDFRAKILVKQIRTPAALMAHEVAFGRKCRESFAKFDPDSHSLKTLQCLLFEDSTESCATLPEWGLMQDGECFAESLPEFLNAVPVCSLSRTENTPPEYQIKTPSMLRAIERGWMQLASDHPTLTTKIRERAPCPYWETPIGPRYLTEGESEALMDWPIGWSAKNPLETDKFRAWLNSHGKL